MTQIDGARIREALLQAIANHEKKGSQFQSRSVLEDAASALGIRGDRQLEQALLSVFSDLFRQGLLMWGYNIDNAGPPFMHLAEHGRAVLRNISRDPMNPDGYIASLKSSGHLQDHTIAMSYITEAIATYNADCYKSASVMVGGASEALLLDLRDAVVNKIKSAGGTPNPKLEDWKAKTVRDAIEEHLLKHKKAMGNELFERFTGYWRAFTEQVRYIRNEAGHPTQIDPVTREDVHASLLTFHEIARMVSEVKAWVITSMPT